MKHTLLLALLLTIPLKIFAGAPLFEDSTGTITGPGGSQNNGGGVAWIDYNNDGWQDLYIVDANGPNKLYRNEKDGTFTLINNGDASELTTEVCNGVAIGDFDNDGWDDIFVANGGTSNSLLKNNNGNGTFTEVTINMNLANETKPSYVATFGDMDGDGDLDLYVGTWDPSLQNTNDYYENLGDPDSDGIHNGFQRIDNSLTAAGSNGFSFVFGAVMSDYDDNNTLDMVVASDFTNIVQDAYSFYRNNPVGTFNPEINAPIVPSFGMGAAAGDYNRDGLLDYYITSQTDEISVITYPAWKNQLVTNIGAGQFDLDPNDNAKVAGFDAVYWGTAFLDVDNDGWLDLYVGNDLGGSLGGPTRSFNNRLYINNGNWDIGNGAFTDQSAASNSDVLPGLGVAIADYDKDGRMDIAVTSMSGDFRLLHNITPPDNNWLEVSLVGTASNMRGIGAKIRINSTSTTGTITQLQEVHAGSSHGSTNAFPEHFGLPFGSTINWVWVVWPSGQPQVVFPAALNESITIIEGVGIVLPPRIVSFLPPTAKAGDFVAIFGENFCVNDCNTNQPGEITITIGGVTFIPDWVQNDLVTFTLPTNVAVSMDPIIINVLGQSVISSQDFIVTPASDGDLNMDGVVNVADLLLATRLVFGPLSITSAQLAHGDVAPLVNGQPLPDGQFNLGDLLVIQRKVLGLVNF